MGINVTIMNETGHTEMEAISMEETIEVINNHPTHWLFVDGSAVQRSAINTINWETVNEVTLSPAIVGGN
tara:strand:+ start:259 stop:468 length:210 start_codon:yes stop_codon:yes gene_type:complete